jgi:DNA-directed RNA polymerase subunit RPC12/RpoP
MTYSTITGIDAEHYREADTTQPGITRIDYHCRRCGQKRSTHAAPGPLTLESIHDEPRCFRCGYNGVEIDAIFVGDREVPRHETPLEASLRELGIPVGAVA